MESTNLLLLGDFDGGTPADPDQVLIFNNICLKKLLF
jgi:hypothetical protein